MKRAEPGWLVLALAGIAAGIGSSLPFYTFTNIDLTVWNQSLFPTATLISVLVALIGLEALFVLVMGHEPRSPFLNFTWSQARLAGSFFAIVLALSYLVQGRGGGDLGSGYLILSLSTLASFAGAVMTRRAELARGREEIVTGEHPWRAAALRRRREVTAKVETFAAGTSSGTPRVQPAPVSPDGEELAGEEQEEKEKPAAEPEEPAREPSLVPRLSAVHSEPEAEEKPKPKSTARKPAKRTPKKAAAKKAAGKKAAAKKTVGEKVAATKTIEPEVTAEPEAEEPTTEAPTTDEPTAEPSTTDEPTAEPPTAEAETAVPPTTETPTTETPTTEAETTEAETTEAPTTAEVPTTEVPTTDDQKTEELKTEASTAAEQHVADATGDTPPAQDGEAESGPESETPESDNEEERERPAAPG